MSIIAELSKRLAPASEYMAKVQAQQSRERVRGLEAEKPQSSASATGAAKAE